MVVLMFVSVVDHLFYEMIHDLNKRRQWSNSFDDVHALKVQTTQSIFDPRAQMAAEMMENELNSLDTQLHSSAATAVTSNDKSPSVSPVIHQPTTSTSIPTMEPVTVPSFPSPTKDTDSKRNCSPTRAITDWMSYEVPSLSNERVHVKVALKRGQIQPKQNIQTMMM